MPTDDPDCDKDFVNDIASDVFAVLERARFFQRLDVIFCPTDLSNEGAKCGHSFEHSISILRNSGMDSGDIDDVLAVLKSKGACCDCEVLYNVAEESQFKAEYWKARALELNAGKMQPSGN